MSKWRRDTRCNKSLRHVAMTGWSMTGWSWICATYRSNKISASSLAAACVRFCDKSLGQNLNRPMREHQLVSGHDKFELVNNSSLPKLIACTEQVSYRSDLSQHQCRWGGVSHRVSRLLAKLGGNGFFPYISYSTCCGWNFSNYE